MRETRMVQKPCHETVYTCDTCSKEFTDISWGRVKRCHICGGDVCEQCAIITDSGYLEAGNFSGDHPDYYCPRCWEEGAKIREKILKLRHIANNEEAELWKQWRSINRLKVEQVDIKKGE